VREQVEVEDHVALYMSISPFSGKNYFDPAYRALRTNRYTFVRTSDDDYYLFDDVEDPFQLNNLADDSDAVEIRKDLEQELVQQLDEIDDPFREKEYYLEKWGYEIGKHGEVPYSR
jgi:hypothetical protein